MIPRQGVRRVRRDQAESRRTRHARQEARQAARRAVRILEILDHDQDGLSLSGPFEDAPDRLVEPDRPALGIDRPPAEGGRLGHPVGELGDQADHGFDGRAEDSLELGILQVRQELPETP